MLLKAWNKSLIEDREKTQLAAAAASGATTLTVTGVDSNAWSDNNFLIVGEIGSPTAELMQVNGGVSDGTSLTIDQSGSGGLRFAHALGEPVYRIDFDRVQFLRSTTDDSSSATQLTLAEIQPDDHYTRYEDTSNTTGYGFIRFYNSNTLAYSSYSDGVNYEATGTSSSYDPKTLWVIRRKVRKLLDENRPNSKLTDREIDEAVNDRQRDVAHQRLWSFYEAEKSFSAVANQFAYTIPSTIQKVYGVVFDTQPLGFVNYNRWKLLHFDTDTTSDSPDLSCVWNGQILIAPRPTSAAQTTTLNGGITATDTTITVTSTSGFNRGDYYRFIIDSEVIYATASTTTTFTGCLRGQEGTTAATHTDTTTVTERDIVYTGHEEPTDLTDTQDRTKIPEPDILAYGAAIDLAPLVNKQDMVQFFDGKYNTLMVKLEAKYAVKHTSQFGRVKHKREVVSGAAITNPNEYPKSISGTV